MKTSLISLLRWWHISLSRAM
ncbi:trp operon leader peptide [Yersinia pestis]|uniref:trp operon leader peptide n=4 Tax=Yersinia pseudotuberculosis complex TaxID=1649845 RepID=A0A5P8YM46_YERPE|nr:MULTISPECIES: trp operon leader peptide [Yersinia pseudotuberculosis complex]PNM26909.1 trp operon leader peptide [Yersinia enterocolitica]ABS48201.1 trp operon leader peptide [Yersinia pseudotuberculosis IP 31758]ADV98445.1 putative trp operon leader peptide [Yersinia pestis biovar Medievalis str. Harbin 35]ANW16389.1 trp operon leader peptide [Yersinia pestis]AXY35961.1 trp operon leader peptide [Yersinia pseudotuberculosis]